MQVLVCKRILHQSSNFRASIKWFQGNDYEAIKPISLPRHLYHTFSSSLFAGCWSSFKQLLTCANKTAYAIYWKMSHQSTHSLVLQISYSSLPLTPRVGLGRKDLQKAESNYNSVLGALPVAHENLGRRPLKRAGQSSVPWNLEMSCELVCIYTTKFCCIVFRLNQDSSAFEILVSLHTKNCRCKPKMASWSSSQLNSHYRRDSSAINFHETNLLTPVANPSYHAIFAWLFIQAITCTEIMWWRRGWKITMCWECSAASPWATFLAIDLPALYHWTPAGLRLIASLMHPPYPTAHSNKSAATHDCHIWA